LSEALQAACLVKVGDKMPDGELVDFDAQTKNISSLYGKKLTVVCFWSIGGSQRSKLVAAAVLKDLANEVADPFAAKGVAVVAVNVGDPTDEARKYIAEHEKSFVNLRDLKGEYFARLAGERKTPRTYLLDAKGKILWFDVEYSRSARRDLLQGIEVALKEAK
jgi:peroxiredoxin